MRVRLERNWQAGAVDVYLYRRRFTEGTVEVLELPTEPGTVPTFRTVGMGEEPGPPTLTLPEDALEALVAAAGDFLPPSREQAAALDDARKMRDRLLDLVETTVNAVHRSP